MINKVDKIRRKLLTWTPPLISTVVIPAHAQMSVCGSMPVLSANTASKCAGDPPVGQVFVTLLSDAIDPADVDLTIIDIAIMGASADDVIVLPTLPAQISDVAGIEIEWSGPATDAITCLPLSTIRFDITYSCNSASDQTVGSNLTDVLADAIF